MYTFLTHIFRAMVFCQLNISMKLSGDWNTDGKTTVNESNYTVVDNETLKTMVLSGMTIKPNCDSYRHKHSGHEEIYMFVRGTGIMQLDENPKFNVKPGDIVLVPDGTTHEVWNDGKEELYFLMVYGRESIPRKPKYTRVTSTGNTWPY